MLIELSDINKTYRSEDVETLALSDIDLKIGEGEFVAVMGPSGCGKTTLLNVIGMLDQVDSGSYKFQDEEMSKRRESQLTDVRKNNIGFVFQSFNLISELTVKENVELALIYHDISAAERRQRVAEVMERMGITHRARHKPPQLSGGQQQRVAIARALVLEPVLILADEPTGNLDSIHGSEVMDMLTHLNDEGTTVVMVTHSEQHAQTAQRVVELFDGKVVTAEAA